ncbi:MAG TPA: Uma2 family endonuclease [Candidatus Obscuribacterales bacterium]
MAESYKVPYRKPSTTARMTPDEYLASESHGNGRHEYVGGYIFAMTGASDAHNVIAGNLFALLHAHLRGTTGCRAYINEMKAKIEATESFYYPDVMVTCEPFEAKSLFKKSPCLIIEVSSPSTKHIDRREKLVAYHQLESLREYLIVNRDKTKVEYFRKTDDSKWIVTDRMKR